MSNLLEKNNIHPSLLGCLMFIKLNSSPSEYISEMIKTRVFDFKTENDKTIAEILEEEGFVKYTKTGKKDPWFRIRLSDKGDEIIKSLSQKPEHELASECWEELSNAYKLFDIDKAKIVNKTKTTFYISEFLYEKERQGKAYTTKMFKAVVYSYLGDFDYEKKIYVKQTLKLLFDPSNTYSAKWNIEDCPLWDWSEKHKENIKETYKKL